LGDTIVLATMSASIPSRRLCRPALVAVVAQLFALALSKLARKLLRALACFLSRPAVSASFLMKPPSAWRSFWQAVAAAARIFFPQAASLFVPRLSPALASATSALAAASMRLCACETDSVVSTQSAPLFAALASAAPHFVARVVAAF
jgi:hypothetical protein